MRVLHLDSGREMRGGQWQALYLIEEMRRRQMETALFCRGPLLEECMGRGIAAKPLSLRAVWRESAGWDLIHAHDARSHTMAAVAARCPFVVSRRVAFPVGSGVLSRWKYGRAQGFLAVSSFVRGELMRAGVDADRIAVVPDATPLPEPVPRTAWRRIVAFDFDDPQKGTRLARDAAALAGIDLTFTRNLERDLRGATALLYLTYSEGLGSAILMAMAHGVAVIASRVGGIPEIVEDGVTGLLVENRATDVAAALTRLYDDPGYADELGANGRRKAESAYTTGALLEKTISVYKRVLEC